MKIPEGKINIRSSSLATLASCARMFAFQQDRESGYEAHPDIGQGDKKPTPGYVRDLGTTFHKVVELGKYKPEDISTCLKEAVEANHLLPNFFDEKFTDLEKMEKALAMMVAEFRKSPHAREWTDTRAKSRYEIELTSEEIAGVFWSGHVDCINEEKIIDLKTTVYTTPDNLYVEQMTSYRLLFEQSGQKVDPVADIVKVSRLRSPNPRTPPKVARYSVDTTLHEKRVIELVKRGADLVDKKDSWKKNLNRVPCNPHSKTCSYCPLRNTSACKETQFTTHE